MEKAAIYHRPDSEMAYLIDKNTVQIRLRAKKNDLTKVTIFYGDPYDFKKDRWQYQSKEMRLIFTGEELDYWQVELTMPKKRLQYAFLVTDGIEKLIYDERHFFDNFMLDKMKIHGFRLPYFHEIDCVKTPKWAKKTIWYQIFPERFANGDLSNDPKETLPWGSEKPTRTNFFGGDLKGIIDHLDYLKKLGVNGIYLCPIFKAHSNHKYDTIDYFKIDEAFGTKETFKKLVKKAHQLHMKVMLDAVFNHLGDFSKQFKDVLKNGVKSRYADWFHINSFPPSYKDVGKLEYAEDITYDVFADTPHMPKLNTANREVKAYLLQIATYWIKNFDIDAWRLDVANEIDHQFWREFYTATHEIKPDFYILGEVWHSAQSWLTFEFDGVMNYPLSEAIIDSMIEQKTSLKQLKSLIADNLMLYRNQNNQVMLNVLNTHDTPRLLTMCHGNKKRQRQVLLMQFVQIGVPSIYYGTEIGMEGGGDPLCRGCMEWDEKKQDLSLFKFVKKLISLRKKLHNLFSYGELVFEEIDDKNKFMHLIRKNEKVRLDIYFNLGEKNLDLSVDDEIILKQKYTNKLHKDGFLVTRRDLK